MKTVIYFRADGHSKIGLGHVIRSLALADCLKERFDCRFIIRNPSDSIRTLIEKSCSEIYELPEFSSHEGENFLLPPEQKGVTALGSGTFTHEAELLSKTIFKGNEILVLDGYNFDSEYQKILKLSVGKLVCIDDIHSTHFHADVIINHAAGVTENDYSAEAGAQFCFGFDYLLLREPILRAAASENYARDNRNFLICLGGADPKNDTIRVLKMVATEVPEGHIYVIVGSAYQYEDELNAYRDSNYNVTILRNLNAEEMAEVMKSCGTAITSPSTVSLEYLVIGGNLFLYQIADNQTRIFNFLTKNQLAFDFEKFGKTEPIHQNVARANQKAIIDGKSPKRLINIFRALSFDLSSNLRWARGYDVMDYFELANESGTRQGSFSKEKIPFSTHEQWFYRKLANQNVQMYLLEIDGEFAGQIRFDVAEKAIVSYSIAPKFRGMGYGKLLLKKGIEKFRKETNSNIEIEGFVKKENKPSNRIFQNLGFRQTETKELPNAFRYALEASVLA